MRRMKMKRVILRSFRKCLKRDCRLAFYLSVLSQPTDKLYPNLPFRTSIFSMKARFIRAFFF
nr:MAG TPA: hypothetical protein [Caudoviricetes sp.]